MPDHLRLAAADPDTQRAALLDIVGGCAVLMPVLATAEAMNLPDCWLVSGAIYNRVWNALTDRPPLHGIKDLDLFYFDPDTSKEAEDAVIEAAARCFPPHPPVEVRNQARVHLWYEDWFGQPYSALRSAREGIDRFASKTHSVGVRLQHGRLQLYAPYGLSDLFAFRVTPNPIISARPTYEAKAARHQKLWPELTVLPWPDSGSGLNPG